MSQPDFTVAVKIVSPSMPRNFSMASNDVMDVTDQQYNSSSLLKTPLRPLSTPRTTEPAKGGSLSLAVCKRSLEHLWPAEAPHG